MFCLSCLRSTLGATCVLIMWSACAHAAETAAPERKDVKNMTFVLYTLDGGKPKVQAAVATHFSSNLLGPIALPYKRWYMTPTRGLVFYVGKEKIILEYQGIVDGRHRYASKPAKNGTGHLLCQVLDREELTRILLRPYTSQQWIDLDIGEEAVYQSITTGPRRIRLLRVEEEVDSVRKATVQANVRLAVDGQEAEIERMPFSMPTEVNGLKILVTFTSEWKTGARIPKRARLAIWDGNAPIVDTDRFTFPLPDYALMSHQGNGWIEMHYLFGTRADPVITGHNEGIDFCGLDGQQPIVSCVDGYVSQGTNPGFVCVQDEQGIRWGYDHVTPLGSLKVGDRVRRGDLLGYIGTPGGPEKRTHPQAHLHFGFYPLPEVVSSRLPGELKFRIDMYPWLATVALANDRRRCVAVARPHHRLRVGERGRFTGNRCIPNGAKIEAYRWVFDDGITVEGPNAERAFDKPGTYKPELWIRDADGNLGVDFCSARVVHIDHDGKFPPLSSMLVSRLPARDVKAGEEITFAAGAFLAEQRGDSYLVNYDFGDGTTQTDCKPCTAITHAYAKPGIYIVRATSQYNGYPLIAKAKVAVLDADGAVPRVMPSGTFRTWTDRKGRELKAQFVSFADGKALLRLESGRMVQATPDSLGTEGRNALSAELWGTN